MAYEEFIPSPLLNWHWHPAGRDSIRRCGVEVGFGQYCHYALMKRSTITAALLQR